MLLLLKMFPLAPFLFSAQDSTFLFSFKHFMTSEAFPGCYFINAISTGLVNGGTTSVLFTEVSGII